ncbi:2,3-diaminopropionate biosynthesis protein SbnA [Paenibacillaceae bacterium]|nr:2,3-diaminopropionate biosynthesis protein SbnA [Paenibacillaceae bacterium]
MMMEEANLLSVIGNTPLVRLGKLFDESQGIRVYGKLELLNPGGSAKDRPALHMIRKAWDEGKIGPHSVVVESSSGNMAISLAAICRYLNMRFICVLDTRTTSQHIRLLRAYGAEVDLVEQPDAATGEFLPARIQRVQELLQHIPGSYWPNQYANPNNYRSHYDTTMAEIAAQLDRIDYVIGGASTCGTLKGCRDYVQDFGMPTQIVAVDAEGSAIFGSDSSSVRRFPGLGAGIVPPFAREQPADRVIHVSDWEMVAGCRQLLNEEALMAGPSSGGVISAAKRLTSEMKPGAVCVVIVHDRGERYLDTVYNDEWVFEQFGKRVGAKAEAVL